MEFAIVFSPPIGIMLVGCAIASYTDATTGKILNVLTGPMILMGLVSHTLTGDWTFGLYGFLAAAALHYPLWMLGVEKGGDVKLLMGIGACVGWMELIETTFWYAAVYIPVGLAVLIYRKRLGNLAAVGKHVAKKASGQRTEESDRPESTLLWTGPVISVAAVIAWVSNLAVLQ